jgi:exoribonuclease R
MTVRRVLPAAPAAQLWEQLRTELGIDEAFPAEVLADAEASASAPRLPEHDGTDIELCTIDPTGSRDLDQAVGFVRTGAGYRVHYAIADVAAFVSPGSPLDLEAHRRGTTLYAPDRRVPLHPPVLSEGAASLLPGELRPVVLWTHELDADGAAVGVSVRRAMVRSSRQLSYEDVDRVLDAGGADEQLALLREVGELRLAAARERDAVELPTLEQEVTTSADGTPVLTYRRPFRSEAWNAEISLLTGMAAASLMLDAGVGILRTLPPPEPAAVEQLRRSAVALGVAWPDGVSYPDVVSSLDPAQPTQAAVLALVPRLLRGAGYVAFDGGEPPSDPNHSAVAAAYTHCTAPLRRLVDRYSNEVCLAACAGQSPPAWVTDALPGLPQTMAAADRRARDLDRASVDLAEALVLATRVGDVVAATIVSAEEGRGVAQLADPAVRAEVRGADLQAGAEVHVRIIEADPATRKVVFEVAGQP